ncbi:THAP domain-containing protein 2-like [Corythoichthys intestinalis]|uniref:THAP domain-containing protein 2-like n=1 Tax=Corythoichthys intestinalis TaxID=161448 RepID=UPI0025A5E835|nr:THAP domain-containing protein 2-like [Corythoichthys intestinalis]
MPSRCVAMYCSHEGSKLYEWPKKKSSARIWTAFVRVKRKNFSPVPRSVLCFHHFSDDSFDNLLEYSLGFTKMLRLKKNAVPTIHLRDPDALNTSQQNHNYFTPTPRSAHSKRARSRQIDAALSEALLLDCQKHSEVSEMEPIESATAEKGCQTLKIKQRKCPTRQKKRYKSVAIQFPEV